MITCVIFSKDRSAQLDLLLSSVQKNCRHLFSEIRVLYTASNEDYQRSYDILIEEWKDIAVFHKEQNFCEDTKKIVQTDTKLLCFFTDDDIVYKKVNVRVSEICSFFDELEVGCLSLRLGRNTVIQNLVTKEQTNCPTYIANYDNKFLVWDRNLVAGNSNYNYTLSVDGHIFRTKTILNMVKSFEFNHPNDFEGGLQNYRSLISPLMSSLEQSCVVGVPINKVNDKVGNEHGNLYPQSQEEFNKKYLEGKRIRLDKIEFMNVLGTHQEFVLPME